MDDKVVVIESVEQFKAVLQSAGSSRLVIAYFTAKWCGPCRLISPYVSQLSNEYSDVVFCKIDVDSCDDIASKYKVRSMPTFMSFRLSKPINSISGIDKNALDKLVMDS